MGMLTSPEGRRVNADTWDSASRSHSGRVLCRRVACVHTFSWGVLPLAALGYLAWWQQAIFVQHVVPVFCVLAAIVTCILMLPFAIPLMVGAVALRLWKS